MREIKFRAWSKNENFMGSVSSIDWFTGKAYLNKYSITYPVDKKEIRLTTYYTLESIKLIQYTGLKDKNGREIYEGDIVKTNDKYYPIQFVHYTADLINTHDGDWDEWYCGFDLGIPRDECNVLHNQLTPEVEVIGNIYENPELLK